MFTFVVSRKYLSKGALAGFGLLLGIFFVPAFTGADELPAFRQGMWTFHRTMAGKPTEMRRCIDPSENILQKQGCTYTSISKSGNSYTFVADCPAASPGKPELTGRITGTVDVKSDSFYQVVSEGTINGQPVKEYFDARRTGDCN
jgi:hypothetical protein